MQTLKIKQAQEISVLKEQVRSQEEQLKEVQNKYDVLRCSEILQKFSTEGALNEVRELGELTDTLERLDAKYSKKCAELQASR